MKFMSLALLAFLAAMMFVDSSAVQGQHQPKKTTIPLKETNPRDVADLIERVYADNPGVSIKARVKDGCVLVTADAKTTKEIKALIRQVEESNRDSVLNARIRVGSRSEDPAVIIQVLRAIRSVSGVPEHVLGGFATVVGESLTPPFSNSSGPSLPPGNRQGLGKQKR